MLITSDRKNINVSRHFFCCYQPCLTLTSNVKTLKPLEDALNNQTLIIGVKFKYLWSEMKGKEKRYLLLLKEFQLWFSPQVYWQVIVMLYPVTAYPLSHSVPQYSSHLKILPCYLLVNKYTSLHLFHGLK